MMKWHKGVLSFHLPGWLPELLVPKNVAADLERRADMNNGRASRGWQWLHGLVDVTIEYEAADDKDDEGAA